MIARSPRDQRLALASWQPSAPDGTLGELRPYPDNDTLLSLPVLHAASPTSTQPPAPLPECAGGTASIIRSIRPERQYPTCARWTDGSVQGSLCGAAVVERTEEGQWLTTEYPLPHDLTIDVCEAFAMREAVLSVPDNAECAVVYVDSAATLDGLLKFSRTPHAYRFKEQFPLFTDVSDKVNRGHTHYYFVKTKAHDERMFNGQLINAGNAEADRGAKDAALAVGDKVALPTSNTPTTFGIWMRATPSTPADP